MKKASYIFVLILLSLLTSISGSLYAQNGNTPPTDNEETKEVEIVNSDILHFEEKDGKKLTKLKGNVQLKQDQMVMFCDSASLDKDNNQMEAWGHVHIQNDTIDAYSDYLSYDSKIKLVILRYHAWLTDGKAKIVSEEIFYKTKGKEAYYLTGGTVYRCLLYTSDAADE